MFFVTIVTTEVKVPGFHFLEKEYSFIFASVQFDGTVWYKNTLYTQRAFLLFSQNKIIKTARFKGIKNFYNE